MNERLTELQAAARALTVDESLLEVADLSNALDQLSGVFRDE